MGNNATIHYNPAEDLDDLNPGFVTFCVVLQSILCVVGGLGNILTLLAIILSKALHKSYNAYIAHLACMDLIICFAMIPSNIRAISGNHGEPANCAAIGAIALICLVVSILSLMMIGLNRYILICRSLSFYKKIYNKRMIAITFAVMWLWALAVVLPMLSFNGLGWSRKNHYCFFVNYDFITYLYVSVGLAQLGIVVPAGVTASCYVLIIKKLKSTARRLEPRSGNSQNTQPVRHNAHRSQKRGVTPNFQPEVNALFQTMSTSEPVDDDDDDDESSEANRRPTSAGSCVVR